MHGCYEVPEDEIITGMEESLKLMKPWIEAQKEFLAKLEMKAKEYPKHEVPEELLSAVKEFLGEDRIKANLTNANEKVHEATKLELFEKFGETYSNTDIAEAYDYLPKSLRKTLLKE
jgi:polyribonucleotide nucleotidyltransferase